MIDLILMCIAVIMWFVVIIFAGYIGVTSIKLEEPIFKIGGAIMLIMTLALILFPFSSKLGVF